MLPLIAAMTTNLVCWVDWGFGAVDLTGICGASSPAPVAAPAPQQTQDIYTVAYLDAAQVSPFGGQLASDVRGGSRNPRVDADIWCDNVRPGASASGVATILADLYPARDQDMERDHWVIIGNIVELYGCP